MNNLYLWKRCSDIYFVKVL